MLCVPNSESLDNVLLLCSLQFITASVYQVFMDNRVNLCVIF